MRVVPVIDIMHGRVVRAVAGRRDEYRPWVSPLCGSDDPLAVGAALLERAGANELYAADLDAILGQGGGAWRPLLGLPASLWLDAGVRSVAEANALLREPVGSVILGSETFAEADRLGELDGPSRVTASLDFRDGELLRPAGGLTVEAAVGAGVRRIIVLELSRVGTGGGVGTEGRLSRRVKDYPQVEWVGGGGVRGRDDLRRLADLGVSAALVATALHDGRLDAPAG